ncbi:MAG: FG-GAP-like repeat-containing protein [Planctomycetota bacterium]
MKLLFTAIFVLISPLSAQIVGGGSHSYYQWNGEDVNDRFGNSVSNAGDVDGDGVDDIVVGAFEAADLLWLSGMVYVYSGSTGDLLYQWEGEDIWIYLGYSVSGAGDVNGDGFDDIIAGAYGADPGGLVGAGSAYVFSGIDGTQLFRFDGTSQGERLGISVSGGGDLNSDGVPDLLVGADLFISSGLLNAGAVYAYSGADGSLLYRVEGGGSDYRLGWSVSDTGDVNSDGYDDFISGAFDASPGGRSGAGSAFVFSGFDGTILYRKDGAAFSDSFGQAVSGAEDLNSDGYADFLVGAYGASDLGTSNAGTVDAYSGFDGSLLFHWSGDDTSDYLGYSVSNSGDVNGDGTPDIIVGAYGGGYVRVYSGEDGSLIQQRSGRFTRQDGFGNSVSSAGDINGDGFVEFLVGAPLHTLQGPNDGGSVYVMGFNPFLNTSTNTLSATTGGVVEIAVDFPVSLAGTPYGILISNTGTGPSTFRGATIPLVQDVLFQSILGGDYPAIIEDGFGLLNAEGDALAILNLPPLVASNLIGSTRWFAAVSLDPATLLVDKVSIARPLTITQ